MSYPAENQRAGPIGPMMRRIWSYTPYTWLECAMSCRRVIVDRNREMKIGG